MNGSSATNLNLAEWASEWMGGMDTPVNFSHLNPGVQDGLNCGGDTFRMTTCNGTFEYLRRVKPKF
jgi:hypothetical protein